MGVPCFCINESLLIKTTYSYLPGALLPCLHPASRDSAVSGLKPPCEPFHTTCQRTSPRNPASDRSRLLFHDFHGICPHSPTTVFVEAESIKSTSYMSFSSLGLSEQLVRATADQGYETPSPIQLQAIPAVLSGKDVMSCWTKTQCFLGIH